MHRIFPTDVKELKSGGEYIKDSVKGKWLFFALDYFYAHYPNRIRA